MNRKQKKTLGGKRDKVEGRFFICFCGEEVLAGPGDTVEPIKKHCRKEHNLRLETVAERKMILHGDGRDYYMYLYAWDFGEDRKILDCLIRKRK